jgi:hypothetical protein
MLLILQYYKLTNKHLKQNLVLSRLTVLRIVKYARIIQIMEREVETEKDAEQWVWYSG